MPLKLTAPKQTVRVEPGGGFDIELFMTETRPVGVKQRFSPDDESLYEKLSNWRRNYKLTYISSFNDELDYGAGQSTALYRTRPRPSADGTARRRLQKQELDNERNIFAETTQGIQEVEDGVYQTMPLITEEKRIPPSDDRDDIPDWYDGAPLHYHFELEEDIDPGTYDITFLLSYSGKNDGDIDRETITVEVLDSVERNRTLLQYGTLIAGLAAGSAAIVSAQNTVLTAGIVAIATLLVLGYLRFA